MKLRSILVAGLLLGCVALPALAATPRLAATSPALPSRAVEESRLLVPSPGAGLEELVTLNRDLPALLLQLPMEGELRIAEWPVSPGVRLTVTLTRHDVYAPGARIVKIVPEGEVEVPRSRWAFFWGGDDEGVSRVVVSVDPESGLLRGMAVSDVGVVELRPPTSASSRQYRVAIPAAEASGAASMASFTCAEETLPPVPPETARTPMSAFVRPEATAASFTKSAVVAIETDNEYMLNRFGDDTTAAVNTIASLFANTNVTYERDVSLHLLQGYTILRVSSVPDPYVQNAGGNADGAKLSEFGNYWNAHYGAVKRTVAAMLSGKQGGGGASGIAWVGGLCSSFYGYSFQQLFISPYLAGDTLIFGHEVGHNFGSPHTHCYSPPADICYSGECYVGPTACPTPATMQGVPNVAGTLMSYCHLIGCSSLVFHPRTMSEYFNANIAGASSCIFNVGGSLPPGPTVSSIGPASGLPAGGTPVTIAGSNFSANPTVAFIDLTGSVSVTVGTATAGSITATTPAHAAGKVDVVVMNSTDYQTGTLRNGFTYTVVVPPPTVSSVTPTFGPVAGGTVVTIAGANFVSGATVAFGAASVSSTFVSSTTLRATAPAGGPGIVSVKVTNPDAQTGTLPNAFTYNSGIGFYTVTPCRVIDTRNANGPYGGPALAAGADRTFVFANQCGIPAGAKAVSLNVAVTQSTAGPGFLTFFPVGAPLPTVATINYSSGQTRANNGSALLGAGTDLVIHCGQSTGTVHVIVDANGYYQ